MVAHEIGMDFEEDSRGMVERIVYGFGTAR